MLDILLTAGNVVADVKSPMRLNSAHADVTAHVNSFVDTKAKRTRNDVAEEYDQALLRLSFPSLATDNNEFTFTLRFPNKTVKDIAQDIALYNYTTNLPKANSNVAKAILGMCDDDGVVKFESLSDFASNFKLSGSTSKLYSILRENKASFDLSKFADSLLSLRLQVQTYYNDKLDGYTIATTDFVVKTNEAFAPLRTPRAKASGALWS